MLFFLAMAVRVRFAPSPTGYLHVGGARTALFNWLFALQNRGTFILRIEDTDAERSSTEMVDGILQGMKWLGLDWDEGPYYQSQRLELYRGICQRLLEAGQAYRCFCSPQLLEEKKEAAKRAGSAWHYDRSCRNLAGGEEETRLRAHQPFALRLKVPLGQEVSFHDRVYGTIAVESVNIEDFVVLRSEGMPTYHLCVVADDVEMKISHVIRGADHLSNTSKHVLLYRALGESVPCYAHLPLILGSDKKRLSKRHGATSVMEYKRLGYLAAATRNYLALLGWSAGSDQEGRDAEIFDREELIERFELDRINKSNAVFDPRKLEWMNGQHIRRLSSQELESKVRCLLQEQGLWENSWEKERRAWLLDTLDFLKSRARTLRDFADLGRPFFTDQFEYEADAVEKYLSSEDALIRALQEVSAAYSQLAFDLETAEKTLRETAERHSMKAGALIGAIRVALTGKAAAPGLFEVMMVLGREKTLCRLDRLLRFLR